MITLPENCPWTAKDFVRRVVAEITVEDEEHVALVPEISRRLAMRFHVEDYATDEKARKRHEQAIRKVLEELRKDGHLERLDSGLPRAHQKWRTTKTGEVLDRRLVRKYGDLSRVAVEKVAVEKRPPPSTAPASEAPAEEQRAIDLADELSELFGLPEAAVTTVDKVPGYRLALSLDTLGAIVARTKADRAELDDRGGRLERLEDRVRELRKQVDDAAQQGELNFAGEETLLDRCASVASELFAAATDVSSPDGLFELATSIGKATKALAAEGWESRK